MESVEKGLKLLVLKLTFNVCLKVWNIHFKITKMVTQAPMLLKINFLSEKIWIILKLCSALNFSIA